MSIEIQPYFAEGERYPALVGVRAEGDEYETAYVSKSELVDALAENAKLREQTELLVTLLRNDCDIEASWDGLRKFWYIGLTESGCLMRDRACKAEAENAKLWELVRHMHTCMEHYEQDGSISCDRCPLDNDTQDCDYEQRMRELGIEVDA